MAALGFDVKPDHLNTRLRLRKYSNRKENLAERLNPRSNLVGVVENFPSSKKTEERTLFFTGETEALGISVTRSYIATGRFGEIHIFGLEQGWGIARTDIWI